MFGSRTGWKSIRRKVKERDGGGREWKLSQKSDSVIFVLSLAAPFGVSISPPACLPPSPLLQKCAHATKVRPVSMGDLTAPCQPRLRLFCSRRQWGGSSNSDARIRILSQRTPRLLFFPSFSFPIRLQLWLRQCDFGVADANVKNIRHGTALQAKVAV